MQLVSETTQEFVVARVSANYNSFGLRAHVLMNRAGEAYQLLMSYISEKNQGDRVNASVRTFDNGRVNVTFPSLSGECQEFLGTAPAHIAAEAFGEAVVVTVQEKGKKVTRAPKLSDTVAVSRRSKRLGVVTEDELRSGLRK